LLEKWSFKQVKNILIWQKHQWIFYCSYTSMLSWIVTSLTRFSVKKFAKNLSLSIVQFQKVPWKTLNINYNCNYKNLILIHKNYNCKQSRSKKLPILEICRHFPFFASLCFNQWNVLINDHIRYVETFCWYWDVILIIEKFT